MERYLKLTKIISCYHLRAYIILAVLYILVTPLFMGTENLNMYESANAVECYVSLLGVILLVAVWAPDCNLSIREVIRSKKEPMMVQYLIRLGLLYAVMMLLGGFFLQFLKMGNCQFPFLKMYWTFVANATFLGGMGMFLFALTDQAAFSYMLPLAYYAANFGLGGKKLGYFYLFSMQEGRIKEKMYLFASGMVFLMGGILIRQLTACRKR